MKITVEEAARIAKLARLRLDQPTLELFARQFGDILGYMDALNELDTSRIDPLYGPFVRPTPLREDRAGRRCRREEILSQAPETDGQFFIVPRIV